MLSHRLAFGTTVVVLTIASTLLALACSSRDDKGDAELLATATAIVEEVATQANATGPCVPETMGAAVDSVVEAVDLTASNLTSGDPLADRDAFRADIASWIQGLCDAGAIDSDGLVAAFCADVPGILEDHLALSESDREDYLVGFRNGAGC